MKSKILTAICICIMPFITQAQLKGIMQKAKSKVNQRVDSKVDKAMDDALDKAEGKPTSDVAAGPSANTNSAIDASPIETDGKEATQPVADGKTREGKAANRRVEFTKL